MHHNMTTTEKTTQLEQYFQQFRKNIIGIDQEFESPFGTRKIIYTDWTASGRLYRPIEEKLINEFGPFVANTHTETTVSGTAMTMAYHEARHIIKKHVNSNEDDILIVDGSGMTGVVNKFQRILGLKVPENLQKYTQVPEEKKPETGPKYLDDTALSSPVVALSGATREVLRVGDLIESMLIRTMRAFNDNNLSPLADIGELERQVDALQQEVKIYLSRLGRQGVTGECAARSIVIIDYAINLEHVGDIIEKGLQEQVRKKIVNGLKFSEDGYKELANLFKLTIDNLRIAQTIFVTRDSGLARQLMEVKVDVRRMEKQSSERHLERLRDGRLDSLQTSSLHLDMLRDLKRVNAHLVSVAYPILDENGLLTESRLRSNAN